MDNTKSEAKQMNDSFIDANNVRAAACCKWCARRTVEGEEFVCKAGGCKTYATDVCDLFSHVDEVKSYKCVMIEVLAECLDGELS